MEDFRILTEFSLQSEIGQHDNQIWFAILEYVQASRILNSRVNEFALERDTIQLVDTFEIGEAKNSARKKGIHSFLHDFCGLAL